MDEHYGYHTNHPLLKLLNLRDNLLTFKQAREETILELWQRFKAILQTYPSHGMTDKTLLDCFYRGLEPKNRSIAEHLFEGEMLNQPYEVVTTLLDKMVETKKEAQKKYEWKKLVVQVHVLFKRVTGLEEQAREKEKNFSLRECKQGKRHEGKQSNDTCSLIQQKVDEHDKKLNEMKDNIDMLNEVTTLNSITIQLQDAQITHMMTGHYPPFTEDSPNYTMGDSEDEE